MVGNVNRSVDPFKSDEVAFDPITESKVFDVNVTCACRRFLGIRHSGAAIVIFICKCCSFLRDIKVPEDATNE